MDHQAKPDDSLRPLEARRESERRVPWQPPFLEELPPLTELTLQTGGPIGGGGNTGGSGSTVF